MKTGLNFTIDEVASVSRQTKQSIPGRCHDVERGSLSQAADELGIGIASKIALLLVVKTYSAESYCVMPSRRVFQNASTLALCASPCWSSEV